MKKKFFIAAIVLAVSGAAVLKARATGAKPGDRIMCDLGNDICYIINDVVVYGKLVIITEND